MTCNIYTIDGYSHYNQITFDRYLSTIIVQSLPHPLAPKDIKYATVRIGDLVIPLETDVISLRGFQLQCTIDKPGTTVMSYTVVIGDFKKDQKISDLYIPPVSGVGKYYFNELPVVITKKETLGSLLTKWHIKNTDGLPVGECITKLSGQSFDLEDRHLLRFG